MAAFIKSSAKKIKTPCARLNGKVISHGKPLLLTGKTLCNISPTCNFTTTPSALTGCWIFLTDQCPATTISPFPGSENTKEWDSAKHFGNGGNVGVVTRMLCPRGILARRLSMVMKMIWDSPTHAERLSAWSINAQKVWPSRTQGKAGLYYEPLANYRPCLFTSNDERTRLNYETNISKHRVALGFGYRRNQKRNQTFHARYSTTDIEKNSRLQWLASCLCSYNAREIEKVF